jgi:Caenorhabditis protein of unknown function, DUF268
MTDRYTYREKLTMLLGISVSTLLNSIREAPYFLSCARKYQRMNRNDSFRISLRHLFPILSDRGESAGAAQGHYFHQDLWAARKIFKAAPARHIDIGSRVDGFIAHLLVFMPVTIIDIRPLQSEIPGLSFVCDDATRLSQLPDNSVESLSSLHAAEHFGLGRYGDPVDPAACFQFMGALQRVLAPGGRLYFAVPVGRERVEFNAHRVFAPQTILASFPQLRLFSFSYVGDDGRLHENRLPDAAAHCDYGCGLFEFIKSS